MSNNCPRGFNQMLAWLDGRIEDFERIDGEVKAWIAEGEGFSTQISETLRVLRASRGELFEAIERDLIPPIEEYDQFGDDDDAMMD